MTLPGLPHDHPPFEFHPPSQPASQKSTHRLRGSPYRCWWWCCLCCKHFKQIV